MYFELVILFLKVLRILLEGQSSDSGARPGSAPKDSLGLFSTKMREFRAKKSRGRSAEVSSRFLPRFSYLSNLRDR